MNKDQLRKLYIVKRAELSLLDVNERSKEIASLFFNSMEFNISKINCVHIFLPIENKNEVNTMLIVNQILNEFPSVKIALSRSNFKDSTMEFFEYTKNTKLYKNEYGIPEPDSGNLIQPYQLDLVLIPLLVVDESGNRIGYGKGFYDRFLANCRPDCIKVGLSFEHPIQKIIPDKFDVPVDFCISPTKVYKFRN